MPVILGYLIAAVISIPIRHFAFGDVQNLSTWLTRLFSFSAVFYGWYVEMYIGLVLLIPFINMVIDHLRDTKALLCFGLVTLVITALPGATRWTVLPDYWRSIYPITYFILGAIVRRIQPKINPWLGIVIALMVSAILGAATVLSTDGKLSEALTWEFPDLWITIIVVCLFVALYRVKIPSAISRSFAFGASGCYGGYLLSHLFDAWCYKLIPSWRSPDHYALIFFCITVPIFIVSILLGVLIERITRPTNLLRKEKSKCLH